MNIPPEGKYKCKLSAQAVVYEASTGSLCVALPCQMEDGFTFKHTLTLAKADGTVQTRTCDTIKQVFGWDGLDPFWLMDHSLDGCPLRDVEFEIVGGPETGDKGGQYFKSKWLNPLGGGMSTPEAADRRAVLAKYGSKFRALSGAAATAAAPKAPPTKKAAPPAPPPGTPTATMEEAWEALSNANEGMAQADQEKLWFDTIARLFPNKTNTELKPHEWGKLKAQFTDNLPM